MEINEYKIGQVAYEQTELTWAQDKKLSEMIIKLSKLAGGEDAITLADLPKLLTRHDLLGEFWGNILTRKFTWISLLTLPTRICERIRRTISTPLISSPWIAAVTNTRGPGLAQPARHVEADTRVLALEVWQQDIGVALSGQLPEALRGRLEGIK